MSQNASLPRAQALALARFTLISKITEWFRTPVPLQAALDSVAAGAVLEREGASRPVARPTREDWWYACMDGHRKRDIKKLENGLNTK